MPGGEVGMKKFKIPQRAKLILVITALIVFFEPQSFKEDYFPLLITVDSIYRIFKLILSYIIITMYLLEKRISKAWTFMAIFQVIACLATVVNHGSLIRFVGPAITTLVMIACGEYIIKEKWLQPVTKVVLWYFRSVFAINLITVLLINFIPGMSDRMMYFMGIDNRWIFTILPWMLFEFINYYQDKKQRNRCFMAWLSSEILLLCMWSVAAMIINFFWVVLFLGRVKILRRKMIAFYVLLMANALVVGAKIQMIFAEPIRMLGKDITLSGRTYIWDKILSDLPGNLLLGHGMQIMENDKAYFGSANPELSHIYVAHAHNSFMTVFYRFGLISLLLYTYNYYLAFKNIAKVEGKLTNIFFVVLVMTLILGIFDTFDAAVLYLVFGLCQGIGDKGKVTIRCLTQKSQ